MSINGSQQDICRQVEFWLESSPEASSMTMDALAQSMNLSARTLRRRLAARQTTFSAVFENWRIANAKRLLLHPDTSIQSIAHRLGYTFGSNFERAFKRWTGSTPCEYRKRQNGIAGRK